jgi:hypothetical protein
MLYVHGWFAVNGNYPLSQKDNECFYGTTFTTQKGLLAWINIMSIVSMILGYYPIKLSLPYIFWGEREKAW